MLIFFFNSRIKNTFLFRESMILINKTYLMLVVCENWLESKSFDLFWIFLKAKGVTKITQ